MQLRTTRDVGAFVRDARRRRDLTQEELARRAGVTRRWLSGLEAGKPRTDLGLVLATFAALEIELDAQNAPTKSGGAEAKRSGGPVDLDELLTRFDQDEA